MADAEFFRKQAARCLRLSRTCYDMETARQLREMAAEFMEKAAAREASEDYLPGSMRPNGSASGDMGRD